MKITNKDLRICLVAYALTAASLAWGHDSGPEYIESFDTELRILERGELQIVHRIGVHPHGDEIRRGVYFGLPEDVGPLSDFGATLDGVEIEPSFDDGAIIVAAEQALARHRIHRFVVSYRASNPWWLESERAARLRWSPIIEQFELAWERASLALTWPSDAIGLEFPASGSIEGNRWMVDLRGPVAEGGSGEQLGTIEFGTDPSWLSSESTRRYGADWAWRVLLLIGALGLLGFLHMTWRAVGRDPELGRVPPRGTPPDGISAAAARFIERMGFDQTVFVTALVSLRIKRAIDLSLDADGDSLTLRRRTGIEPPTLHPGERAVMAELFEGGDSVTLEAGDDRGEKASQALGKKLGEEHRGRHFVTNARQRSWGIALGLLLSALAIAALIVQARDELTPDPWAIGLGFVALVIGVFAPLVYFELFKAPTRAGVTVKRQIAGLKRHLEADAPIRDAAHFIELLPYALALDLEKTWRERFQGTDEGELDGDAADVLAWYREVQKAHDSMGAMIPILAAASGATAATGAGAAGGASAGGV